MADDYLPELYTDRDITKARRRGKYVGWVQGGGAVLALGVGYTIIGSWLPWILVLGLVGFVVYKVVRAGKNDD